MEPRNCEICGVEYIPKRNHQKICMSRECELERNRRLEKKRRQSRTGNCIICSKEYRTDKPYQRTCSNAKCKAKWNKIKREKYSCRPMTKDTYMLLQIDLQKGWSIEKVAKINAKALCRDYDDLINHIKAFQGSPLQRKILSILSNNHYQERARC